MTRRVSLPHSCWIWPPTFSVSSTSSSRGCWPWWPVRFSSDLTLSWSWLFCWLWLPSMPCWPRPSMQDSFCAMTTWTTVESKCPSLCSKGAQLSVGNGTIGKTIEVELSKFGDLRNINIFLVVYTLWITSLGKIPSFPFYPIYSLQIN